MTQEIENEQDGQEVQVQIETTWRLKMEETITELLELIAIDYFQVNNSYGFEQMFDEPSDDWDKLDNSEREALLKGVGSALGVNLLTFADSDVLSTYHEDGVPGTVTKKGGEVSVLATKFAELKVHVTQYENPDLITRYDLVRTETSEV